jgi:pSer/pThr/pTyr-binding forkhead associated (FHA) protein
MSKKLLVKNRETIVPELTREIPEHGIFSIGNDSSATLELKDSRVAPEQFIIVCEGNQVTLMCRVDGGQINGQSLPQGSLHNLQPKDVIGVGDYILIFDTAENVEAIVSSFVEKNSAQGNSSVRNVSQKKQKTFRKNPGGQSKAFDSQRSLNDVLEDLRSDEKFYFQVEDAAGGKRRFYVESEEMWLGWSAAGECVIGKNTADIEIPRAQIRKDWSGVVLYPLQTETIRLNSEVLSEPYRLKNDDHLLLLAKNEAQFDKTINIKFHEPTALLVLDSILPKKLPPPVSMKTAVQAVDNSLKSNGGETNRQIIQSTARPTISKGKKSRIFGYFTLTEIMVMTAGTLIASVIIFFVLEYF